MKTIDDILKELKLEEEMKDKSSNIGLMLNSTLAFPHKGETAGSMKNRLLEEIIPYFNNKIKQSIKKAFDETNKNFVNNKELAYLLKVKCESVNELRKAILENQKVAQDEFLKL